MLVIMSLMLMGRRVEVIMREAPLRITSKIGNGHEKGRCDGTARQG